jgi:hypothetical protein
MRCRRTAVRGEVDDAVGVHLDELHAGEAADLLGDGCAGYAEPLREAGSEDVGALLVHLVHGLEVVVGAVRVGGSSCHGLGVYVPALQCGPAQAI